MKGGPCGREQKVKCQKILQVLFAVYFDTFKTELYHLPFDLFWFKLGLYLEVILSNSKQKKDRNIRVGKYYILDFHLSCAQKRDCLLKKKKKNLSTASDLIKSGTAAQSHQNCAERKPKKRQHLLIECLEKKVISNNSRNNRNWILDKLLVEGSERV